MKARLIKTTKMDEEFFSIMVEQDGNWHTVANSTCTDPLIAEMKWKSFKKGSKIEIIEEVEI